MIFNDASVGLFYLLTGEARRIFDEWQAVAEADRAERKAWMEKEVGPDLALVYRGEQLVGVALDGRQPEWLHKGCRGWVVKGSVLDRERKEIPYMAPHGGSKLGRAFDKLPKTPSSWRALGGGWGFPLTVEPGYLWDGERDIVIASVPYEWPAKCSGAYPVPASDYYLLVERKDPSAETLALVALHRKAP